MRTRKCHDLIRRPLCAMMVAASAVAGPLHAEAQVSSLDIVNNLADVPSNLGGVGVGSDNLWAQSFSTPNTSYSVDSVSVKLLTLSPPAGTFTVSLWDSTGGLPGTSLATIVSENVSSISSQVTDYTFIAPGGLTLAASTTYFVVLSASQPASMSNLFWSDTQDANPGWTGPGQVGGWSNKQGPNWDFLITDQPFQFAVTGTPVPEPRFYALISGLGLLGFALLRRGSQSA